MISYTTYTDLIINIRQELINQAELDSDMVINAVSVRGPLLKKLISDYESTSINLHDGFIIFELLENKDSENNIILHNDDNSSDNVNEYKLLLKIYGLFVCLLAGLFLISKKGFNVPTWLQIVLLIIGGFIHGLFVSGGPLLVLALQSKVKEKEKFRATLSFVWVLLNSVLLGQDLINQAWNIEMLILLAISVPTVIVSIIIGKTIFKKLNNDTFMKFAYLLLFISGFFLLR